MMSLPVWLPGPMFLPSRFCPGGGGVFVQGVSVGGVYPPESEKRVVHILLECFLV